MSKKKYSLLILIPVMFNVLFFIISSWIPEQLFFDLYLIPILTVLNTVFATVYMIIINISAAKRRKVKTLWTFILSVLVVLANNLFVYLTWGIKANMLFEPDFETLIIVVISTILPIVSILINTIVLAIKYAVEEKNNFTPFYPTFHK